MLIWPLSPVVKKSHFSSLSPDNKSFFHFHIAPLAALYSHMKWQKWVKNLATADENSLQEKGQNCV